MDKIRMFPTTQTTAQKQRKEEEVCPTCKFPLADKSHGWVKEYREHTCTEKCLKRYGFCLIPCPTCTGGVEAKRQAQLINDLFQDSNIPHYAREWTFQTYPENADQKALWNVQTRITDWLGGKPIKGGLYLVGENGACKTSLAISALHAWLRKGHSGAFIGTLEMFDILKDAINASRQLESGVEDAVAFQARYDATRGAKLHRLVKEVELLILDDLGVECGSAYEVRELYLILERRRSSGLFTIFTSNCHAVTLAHHWRSKSGVFEDSRRIIDRLGEYAFSIPVAGRNQRERGK